MKNMLTTLCLAAGLATTSVAAPGTGDTVEPNLAIAASHVLVDGGVVLDDAMVLVGDGRILAVGATEELEGNLPDGVEVVHHDGWLSAGLVAANSTLGLAYGSDSTGPFMDGLDLLHGFDPATKGLEIARGLGVTTLGVEGDRGCVIGGLGAVVKSDGQVLKKRANVSVCMAVPAVRTNRYPTSFGSAMREVRERFGVEEGPLAEARKGALTTSIAVNDRADISRAISLTRELGLRTVLRGGQQHGDFAKQLAESKIGVALAPLGLSTGERDFNSMKALVEAGVPFAFGLADNGNAVAGLRESAALAVRGGVDRASAWKAVTSNAARLAGVGERVGRVATGLDADLVLWTGDPLLVSTTPVTVYVGGAKTQGDSH